MEMDSVMELLALLIINAQQALATSVFALLVIIMEQLERHHSAINTLVHLMLTVCLELV
jgi:hypothetical protein